ncbi:lipopolysaccharide biosynthesis protein [Novosphingobium sp. ZW T3_23]|uniref:lipopolysaccharide biosynthesis protein n=1 Tax=Novosphingobium sp. ZW T3_23 TaxID=3378084 RepID=UPI003851D498
MMKQKVAHSAAIMAIFQLSSRVFDVAALLVLARVLVPADFGLVAIATSVLLILTAVTEMPVIDILVQRGSVEPRDVDAAFTTNLMRGLGVAALMIALSFPVAEIYGDPRLVPILCALSLVPLGKNLESPGLVHAVRELNYGPTAQILLFGKLWGTVLSIALAFATHSYWALIAGVTATAIASATWSYVLAPYRPRIQFTGVWSLMHFAGWVTLSRIFFTINQQGDRFFIGHMLGTARLGTYTMGGDISSIATNSLAAPILRPMFAAMARIQEDTVRLRAAYIRCQQVLTILILPLGVGMAAVADVLIPLILRPQWHDARIVIWWIAPVVALQMLSMPVQAASMARGRPVALTIREGAALVMRLPATLIATYFYGFEGAVISRSVTGLLIILFNMNIARKLVGASVTAQIVGVWRSLASSSLMVIAILAVRLVLPPPAGTELQVAELTILVLLGGATYGAAHLLLWKLAGFPKGAEAFLLEMVRTRGKARVA